MQRRRSGLCGRVSSWAVIAGVAVSGLGCGDAVSNRPDAGGPAADAAAADAAAADAAAPDAAVLPRCDPSKPFGAPVRLANVNSNQVDQGAILADELTLYFGSTRPDGSDGALYAATRRSPNDPFGQPDLLPFVNGKGSGASPSVTGDLLTLFYFVGGDATADIHVSKRSSPMSAFPVGSAVTQVNLPNVADVDPFVTADGAALYFGSSRGGIELNLVVSVRQADGSFGVPQPVANLNTPQPDSHPVVSRDGLTIYWSSTRTDGGAQGGTDIWRATRSSTAGAFGTPVRVPELNTRDNESPSWLAPDGCSILLHSNRMGGLGLQDIYEAVKPM